MENKINILSVDINKVVPNDYNPKDLVDNSEENKKQFDKVVKSLKYHGYVDAVIVRELEDGNYEIINGFHRYKALKEMGMGEIFINNLGKIDRRKAIEIALTTEDIKIPLNDVKLAELLKEINAIEMPEGLPYSNKELELKMSILDNVNLNNELAIDKIPEVAKIMTLIFLNSESERFDDVLSRLSSFNVDTDYVLPLEVSAKFQNLLNKLKDYYLFKSNEQAFAKMIALTYKQLDQEEPDEFANKN